MLAPALLVPPVTLATALEGILATALPPLDADGEQLLQLLAVETAVGEILPPPSPAAAGAVAWAKLGLTTPGITMLLPLEHSCSNLPGFFRICSSSTAFWLEIISICRSNESIIASEYAGDAGTCRPGVSAAGVNRPGAFTTCCCCCFPQERQVPTGVRNSSPESTQSTASSDEARICRGNAATGRNGSAWRNSRATVQASPSCASADCSSDSSCSTRPSSKSFRFCTSLTIACSWCNDSSRSCRTLRNRNTSGSS